MFQTRAEKIKTRFVFNNLSPENRAVYENMGKYGTAKQAIDDNIIRRMRVAYSIIKATGTHTEYVIRTYFFHANAPQCHVIRNFVCLLPYTVEPLITDTVINEHLQ